MSLTRIDQQQLGATTGLSDPSLRRSSLLVNLSSSTKRRSSVTTRRHSRLSSLSQSSSGSRGTTLTGVIRPNSPASRFLKGESLRSPHSAPPLLHPSRCSFLPLLETYEDGLSRRASFCDMEIEIVPKSHITNSSTCSGSNNNINNNNNRSISDSASSDKLNPSTGTISEIDSETCIESDQNPTRTTTDTSCQNKSQANSLGHTGLAGRGLNRSSRSLRNILQLEEELSGGQTGDSRTNSPVSGEEPVVEVRKSSSSSSNASSDSSISLQSNNRQLQRNHESGFRSCDSGGSRHVQESGEPHSSSYSCSSDVDQIDGRVVRRRSVRRRSHNRIVLNGDSSPGKKESSELSLRSEKAVVAETTLSPKSSPRFGSELTIAIRRETSESPDKKSKFSRQTSSKTTKVSSSALKSCTTSVTTNRKSTTSHHHRQERHVESSSSSSEAKAGLSGKIRSSKLELDNQQDKDVINSKETEDKQLNEHNTNMASRSNLGLRFERLGNRPSGSSSFKMEHQQHQASSSSSSHQQSSFSSLGRGSNLSGQQSSTMSTSTSSSSTSRSSQIAEARVSSIQAGSTNSSNARMSTAESSSSSTSTKMFNSSAASLFSNQANHQSQNQIQQGSTITSSSNHLTNSTLPFLSPDELFSSPARSLVQELGTEFAELENALSCSSSSQFSPLNTSSPAGISSRLFSGSSLNLRRSRLSAPIGGAPPTINFESSSQLASERDLESSEEQVRRTIITDYETERGRRGSAALSTHILPHDEQLTDSSRGDRIQSLLDRARNASESGSSSSRSITPIISIGGGMPQLESGDHEPSRTHKTMAASTQKVVDSFDQKMSDVCRKLREDCQDTNQAIDLIKVMIFWIEHAWSVPVCGDDLGFRLCSSLCAAGGLDIILGYIHMAERETDEPQTEPIHRLDSTESDVDPTGSLQTNSKPKSNQGSKLRLDLTSIEQTQNKDEQQNNNRSDSEQPTKPETNNSQRQTRYKEKDNDSDQFTSDLGLDSTSVESLSYASAPGVESSEKQKCDTAEVETEAESTSTTNTTTTTTAATIKELDDRRLDINENLSEKERAVALEEPEVEDEASLRRELGFLSARLLSQCLTFENRNYIVENGLDSVIKLACKFTTMKRSQSKRIFQRSAQLKRQSSTASLLHGNSSAKTQSASEQQSTEVTNSPIEPSQTTIQVLGEPKNQSAKEVASSDQPDQDASHGVVGSEILQHLFKHSEDTCSRIISLGGLQAILYGCRSSNLDILRHCASALANLALYGGPDSQQTMIQQKAHVWLFPLAFNEDDNVQYYACLAIVVLLANQEIEADVLKSSTLDLVEPFVTGHEPRRFAESTTAHIHGQSADWLRKLIPVLESKREEPRNLAAFHFAMEAYIKREQGRTSVFREIGAVESLRKVGASPIAIAARFACQALRLIGESEPHKLSQQVPLWTNEDVLEWVGQIGFENFRPAFLESSVDGDLLLQLDDEMLRADIGISNGIMRRRFMRELANLKRIADYSSVDKSGLVSLLSSSCSPSQNDPPFLHSYVYPLVQLGVTKDNIHLLDTDQLLHECKVESSIHRARMGRAIKSLQERMASQLAANNDCNSFGCHDNKTLDVFVSYRRSNGSQLASLLKVHLQLRGFSVFIDVERLEAGKFDNNLLDSIATAKNFILVLSPNALDRCIGDQDGKDWVHKEIKAALASNCNIIPIMDNFHWPEAEQLPEDMRSITYFNGVRWIHDYQDACVDKVERFIRGEISNSVGLFAGSTASSSLQRLYPATPSIVATPSIGTIGAGAGSGQGCPPRPNSQPFDADHHPLSFANLNHNNNSNYHHHQHYLKRRPLTDGL